MRILILISFIFLSCSSKHKSSQNISESANNFSKEQSIKNLDSSQHSEKFFTPILDFPIIKDTSVFINQLIKQYNLGVHNISSNQFAKKSITFYKKIKLNGSDDNLILIEYDYGDGSMAEFPWKYQLLFTEEGKLVKILSALHFRFLKIFANQNPFLVALISTARGNGGHQVFRISSDTLENVYDGYNDYQFQTYDAYEDRDVFEPNELELSIKDINKDGYNDIEFNGKLVLIQGVTKDSVWYDTEVRKGKDTIRYSVNHPFKKLPIHYVFLYNNKTEHFTFSERYSLIYSFYH